jgi:chromosomal replication initiation ATPase DnaA
MSPTAYIAPGLKTIEDIAAEVWEIDTADLYVNTRRREVVEARQTLISFRQTHMGQTNNKAAGTYRRDHSTAVYAKKTVRTLIETDRAFKTR